MALEIYRCKRCGGCGDCAVKIRELTIELHDIKQRQAALVYKVPEFVDDQAPADCPTEFTETPGVYAEDEPMSHTELEVRLKKIQEDRLKQEKVQDLGEWPFEDETEGGVFAVREAAQVDALLSNNNVKG